MLCNEPFYLKPEEVGRLTDREAWEWYLKPAVEKARRLRDIRDGYAPADAPAYEPQSEAETLAYLRQIGVVGVPDGPGVEP